MKKIKAEKQLRIPIELTKKIDKITLADLNSIETLNIKERTVREAMITQIERRQSS